jgi:hypothetical protein
MRSGGGFAATGWWSRGASAGLWLMGCTEKGEEKRRFFLLLKQKIQTRFKRLSMYATINSYISLF